MPEEVSLDALRNEIERISAVAAATNDALMCLMEVLSEAEPVLRSRILAKLEGAIESADELETPDIATELISIRDSFRNA